MERENPFKNLGQPPKEVPKELRGKVMEDVAILKFVMETASLFSSNYANVIESFFKKREKHRTDNKE